MSLGWISTEKGLDARGIEVVDQTSPATGKFVSKPTPLKRTSVLDNELFDDFIKMRPRRARMRPVKR